MKNTNTKISSKEACTLAHQIRRETGCSLAEAFKAAYNRNTAPVDLKTSWTAEELNKIFSDKTAELIRKGYVVDLAGMAGSQGEVGKIIFKKNNRFYALVMETKSSYTDGIYTDHYVIWFGHYTEDTSNMRPLDTWNTLWLNKFEATWTQEFVKITKNYFVTIEEAEAMNKKWLERCQNHASKFEDVDLKRYTRPILALVRKQKGLKGVKASEIVNIQRITLWNNFTNKYNERYYKVELSRTNKSGKNITLDVRC